MRFGRNVVRTLLEYYRFTNVLGVPMPAEMRSRKGRPKTHRSRSRKRREYIAKPRPKTTREYAPISYTDLTMHYDYSSTSNENSPTRSGFGVRSTANPHIEFNHVDAAQARSDHYSLTNIRTAKFSNLDFPSIELKNAFHEARRRSPTTNRISEVTISIAPKPSLSIIDFNQLTRGGLDQAKRSMSCSRNKNVP